MGFVDYLRIDLPLEALPDAPEVEFATKSFDPIGKSYRITIEGRLILEHSGRLFRNENDRVTPYDTEYHGWMDFTAGRMENKEGEDQPIYRQYRYKAKFTDGQLQKIDFLGSEWLSNVTTLDQWFKDNEASVT